MLGSEGASSSKKMKISEKPVAKNKSFSALVVDDDPTTRKIHSGILKSVGFEVEVAENGREVIDLLRNGARFQIVFIDMEMPVMDGIEATKEMRDMKVESKIVGVTSRNSEAEKELFMQAGVDVCYTKPLTKDMIAPLVEDLKKNKKKKN